MTKEANKVAPLFAALKSRYGLGRTMLHDREHAGRREAEMAEKGNQNTVKIVLTPDQREQIRRVLGKEVSELELTPEALEERVAPRFCCGGDPPSPTH
jgi:hypothetical protein